MVSASTGIVFNNEMNDFNIKGPDALSTRQSSEVSGDSAAHDANWIQPWKRPLSSMSPMFVLKDGKLRLVIGASGGPHIVTGIIQLLDRILVQGDNVLEALITPRVEALFPPDQLRFENYTFSSMAFAVPEHLMEFFAEKASCI